MSKKYYLSNAEIAIFAMQLNLDIKTMSKKEFETANPGLMRAAPIIKIYPIPRGGIPAAYALLATDPHHYHIVGKPEEADIFIDDIIDSGQTAHKYMEAFGKSTFALIDKLRHPVKYDKDGWFVMPWEGDSNNEEGVESNVTRIIQYIGDDPTRGGLLETPRRFSKALGEWFSGYAYDEVAIKNVLKVFEDGADNYDQMVIVKDIPIYSKCEHHIADIFGTATIAYIPNGKIVGLSKLSRLADIFARRLQVQERLTGQIADALQTHLEPIGVGVIIKARHMCMESRGLCQQGHHTITTALRGALKEDASTRAEFMSLAK